MPEIRNATPYISHLRVTKRPTQKWHPTGYQDSQGQDLYRQVPDLPGIECEITPYMGSVKGPSQQFRFPLKSFFETGLAELQAIEKPNEQVKKAIANLESDLARTDVTWAETVLMAGGLPTLAALWEDVFSDALDYFSEWEETGEKDGIPIEIKEMQWDARIPWEGNRTIDLRVGMFAGKTEPTIHTLSFEDAASRKGRENRMTQIVADIDRIEAELETAEGERMTQLNQELESRNREKAQQESIERGLISDLVALPSVQSSLPTLLMSVLGVLKQTTWPELDLESAQAKLIEALTTIG